jgi:hypothetical protein
MTTDQQQHVPNPVDSAGASTAELVKLASEQVSRLVRDELALARAEMTTKAKRAGTGIGLFGAAGVVALYGVAALIVTLIVALDLVMPLWLAALIVAVVLFLVAGILALFGKKQVTRAVPPEPAQAIQSVKADVNEVKHAVKDRSRA